MIANSRFFSPSTAAPAGFTSREVRVFTSMNASYILIPTNEVDFSPPPGGAVIPRNYHVSPLTKVKISRLFP